MSETHRNVRRLPSLAVAMGMLALAGCGSSTSTTTSSTASTASSPAAATPATTSTSSSSTAPSGALSLAANAEGQLAYTKKTLTASAGKVTIDFTNMSPLAHNMTIESSSSHKIVGATPTFQGSTKPLTLDLKPGTYKFFCSVPGHRMAGMEGTLTVK
jgi:plastocyanin